MPFRVILFDADGTLLDYDAAEKKALAGVLKTAGFTGNNPHAARLYRDINARLWKAFERGEITQDLLRVRRFEELLYKLNHDFSPEDFSRLYLEALREGGDLIPHTLDVLRYLANRGFILAVITNGLKDVQYHRLEKGGITGFFRGIFISEELGVQKPDPGFFKITLEKLGCPPKEDCLVVGDSFSSDIQGGINAGIASCWFNPQRNPVPGSVLPDYEITDLRELKSLLTIE